MDSKSTTIGPYVGMDKVIDMMVYVMETNYHGNYLIKYDRHLHSASHDRHNNIEDLPTIVSLFNDKFGSIPHRESITRKHNHNN
jgi:hypothetical protein